PVSEERLLDEVVNEVQPGFTAKTAGKSQTFPARLWSSETPNVYSALVELLRDGQVIETRRADVGFRKVALRDQQFVVNGSPRASIACSAWSCAIAGIRRS